MGRTTDGLTEAEFKVRARRLRETLEGEGMPKLGHSRALEVLSRVHGYASWHAVQAGLKAAGPAPVDSKPETAPAQGEADQVHPDPRIITLGINRNEYGHTFALDEGCNSAYERYIEFPCTVLGVLSTIDLLDRMKMVGYPNRNEVRKLLPVISDVIRNPVTGEVSDDWRTLVSREGLGECWDFDVYRRAFLENEFGRFGGSGHWYLTALGSSDELSVAETSGPLWALEVIKAAFGHYPGRGCKSTILETLRPVTRAVLAREM